MIARMWHGVVAAEKAEGYSAYLSGFGVRDYEAIPGNRGVWVLRRAEGERVHFMLVSLWESLESIRKYAGPDAERAHYYEYDLECLIDPEPKAVHYEVLATSGSLHR